LDLYVLFEFLTTFAEPFTDVIGSNFGVLFHIVDIPELLLTQLADLDSV